MTEHNAFGKWAFMWYPKTKRKAFMLYDMEKDPRQFTNLANDPAHAAIKRQLHRRLQSRIKRVK